MGAESSSINSIDSLGKTLVDIEHKLSQLESTNLHQSKDTSLFDGHSVTVSGRVIECRPWINLIAGPVVGLVGQTFARVLIETNVSCLVSIDVFEVINSAGKVKFVYQEVCDN